MVQNRRVYVAIGSLTSYHRGRGNLRTNTVTINSCSSDEMFCYVFVLVLTVLMGLFLV